jgi:hypothetical protein
VRPAVTRRVNGEGKAAHGTVKGWRTQWVRFHHHQRLCAVNRREKSEKCAAFVDDRVFNFANQYGQAQNKQAASQ